MKKFLLNLYLWPVFFCLTLLSLVLLPFILAFHKIFLRREIGSALRRSIRIYGWILVRLVPFLGPVRVKGDVTRIPQPAIFIANHSSAIDPYLFGAIPAENCFVTSWPFKIPVYSPLMKLAGYVNTASGWESIQQRCTKMLEAGVFVTIWPEGHRSRDGKLGRFRRGAFQLAVESGFPIQPVFIEGSGKVLQPGQRFLSPGSVNLILLDPLYPDDLQGNLETRVTALRQQAYEAIHNCGKNLRDYALEGDSAATGKSSAPRQSLSHESHDLC